MRKNVLSVMDFGEELQGIIDLGIQLKQQMKAGKPLPQLPGKTLALIFERQSTRTRVSFEVGMTLLGGHAIFLSGDEMGIGTRETPQDVALVLSRYVDAIMYRAVSTQNLQEIATYATVPVINGLDREEHPCQILADLMTIKEKKGRLDGLSFAFIGDGDDNLTHSYLLGCTMMGMNVTVISPKSYWPNEFYITKAKDIAWKKNRTVSITDDLSGVSDADVVATDTWVSLWFEQERQRRLNDLKGYMVTSELMNKAAPDAIFMHCMPIYYDEEVTKEVAHGPHSVIIDEAENRMWAQMALLVKLLS
ncbi:MAG TPA: ornithine carbamoyltransferase [Candidatus Thermoplasmatota archaeon]|nr:ornithine carbamoyltransferase [Candidatus Thermoplasmatota archaeon]